MILTKEKVLEEIAAGNIKIEPEPKPECFGPGSVDLRLGNQFRIFKSREEPLPVISDINFDEITEKIDVKDGDYILLKPGEMVLGITKEKITLSPDLAGWLGGRSRFARVGLAIHTTASFMQPGISNRQVLEITNIGPLTLALYPDALISQFIFERCEGKARHDGKFSGQLEP